MTIEVAVFDFDHTLSSRDNVLPFLRAVAGRAALTRALLAESPWIAGSVLRSDRRDHVKAGLVRRLLGGREEREIRELGRAFAREIEAGHLNAEVVERADWHRAQGHDVVIVSASFATYLGPFGEQRGFSAVLATELEVGSDGRLTGRIEGANCRAAEKARRLDAWLAGREAHIWAYGDGTGDQQLFDRADRVTRVDPHGRLREGVA